MNKSQIVQKLSAFSSDMERLIEKAQGRLDDMESESAQERWESIVEALESARDAIDSSREEIESLD